MTTRQIWEIDDYNRIIDGTTKALLFTVDTLSDDDPLPIMRKIAAAPAMYALLEQISKLRKDWRVADGLSSTEYMDELDTLDIDGLLAQAEGGGHE